MVKIKFLGSTREIGRSAVLLESEETNDSVLMDYGTKMRDGKDNFPQHIAGKNLTAIVLSHSHIDHSGALPLFYISGSVPLYCTRLTYQVTKVLLDDMLHISKDYLPFDRSEIRKIDKHVNFLGFRERTQITENTAITLYNSGHIPGGAQVLVEMDGKTILYTSDLKLERTQLLDEADTDIPPIDVLITESTYGAKLHEPRKGIEDELIKTVRKIIANGGRVLIPAFGVGRSQEILMILFRDGRPLFPVYLDGMARKIAKTYLQYPQNLRDPQGFQEAMEYVEIIDSKRGYAERKIALSYPGVIVAPSGMLKGGTSRYYASEIINDPKSAILLVSYQVEGTPGRLLQEENLFQRDSHRHQKRGQEYHELDEKVEVKAEVHSFDLSSHSGKDEMIDFCKKLPFTNEKKRVLCVHGDKEVVLSFTEDLIKEGFAAEAPSLGEVIELD